MCFCDEATVNGDFGYRGLPTAKPGVCAPDAPELSEGQSLLYDEPGRCDKIDSHSYHYRVVRWYSSAYLLVRHGSRDEHLLLSASLLDTLSPLESSPRYWILNALYHAYCDGKRVEIKKADH